MLGVNLPLEYTTNEPHMRVIILKYLYYALSGFLIVFVERFVSMFLEL